jgi:hypothetical protein
MRHVAQLSGQDPEDVLKQQITTDGEGVGSDPDFPAPAQGKLFGVARSRFAQALCAAVRKRTLQRRLGANGRLPNFILAGFAPRSACQSIGYRYDRGWPKHPRRRSDL